MNFQKNFSRLFSRFLLLFLLLNVKRSDLNGENKPCFNQDFYQWYLTHYCNQIERKMTCQKIKIKGQNPKKSRNSQKKKKMVVLFLWPVNIIWIWGIGISFIHWFLTFSLFLSLIKDKVSLLFFFPLTLLLFQQKKKIFFILHSLIIIIIIYTIIIIN